MIRHLVAETYGGKIDDDGDTRILRDLVTRVLTPEAFDIGHKLVSSPDGGTTSSSADNNEDEEEGGEGGGGNVNELIVPSGTSLQDFMAWIHRLPEREPPTYLGLPANAEKLLLVGLGKTLIGNVRKVTELLEEGEALMAEA